MANPHLHALVLSTVSMALACGSDGSGTEIDGGSPAVDAMPGSDGMPGADAMPGPDGMPGPDAMPGACSGSTTVVINEVRYDVPGNGDAGNEWVELHNRTGSPIDIGGWTLEWGASGFTNSLQIPAATSIAADGYYVIGGSNVAADLATAELVNLGNAATAPDGVRILDDSNVVVDTVLYGEPGENTDNWEDDCGVAVTWAPDTFSSESLARMPNGVDTNAGTDFVGDNSPTMGLAND